MHFPLGDRSRLIEAQDVYPCERLDTIKILYERPFCCEDHRAGRKGNTGEQYEPLRDHTDERAYCFHRIICYGQSYDKTLLYEKQNTDRNDDDADHFQNAVQGIAQLGGALFRHLGVV